MMIKDLCIGTAQFGLEYGISNNLGRISYDSVFNIVRKAINNEIIYFDTAQSYGNSEEILGRVFTELGIGNSVRVTTKLKPDFSYSDLNNLEKNIIGSLEKLKIEKLDCLMLHRSKIVGNWENFLQSIQIIKEKGLIGKFGISVYNPSEIINCIENDIVTVYQLPFNCFDKRWIEQNIFNLLIAKKKDVFIRSIYLQGLFFLNRRQLLEKKMDWAHEYLQLLHNYTITKNVPLEIFAYHAIKSVIHNGKIVFGVDSEEQLLKNIEIFSSNILKNEIISEWWDKLPFIPEYFLNPSQWYGMSK